ncbi:MAG TPA: GNAT family N-acetyltransferase [Stellaceae bacterium]|jgi:ribosomal protein S18 acetylase RimI-like enzyme|nr:GNAT family N-acetyltransferase [Stellaceae bacterium]
MTAPFLDDVITSLEMFERPSAPHLPPPLGKLALMRAEDCTVPFYRFLYETVGMTWLWYERRLLPDAPLAAIIQKPTTEIFVLYAGGVPAGYFELDAASPHETELSYFGLMPEFIGRRLGPFMLQAAIDRAWSRPIRRLWVHTRMYDHPKALGHYQRAGFVVYARQKLRFPDPRAKGILPRDLKNPRLPPLDAAT